MQDKRRDTSASVRGGFDYRRWLFANRRPDWAKALSALAGMGLAAAAHLLGIIEVERSIMNGMALAAVGAIGGLVVHGVGRYFRAVR